MEPLSGNFAFAVDVGAVYDWKRRALVAGTSSLHPEDDRLLALYEAEGRYYGRMLGVGYAEIFQGVAPLLVDGPSIFLPVVHG